MRCPRCKTIGEDHQLTQTNLGNMEVDFCLNCGGMWFDKQELAQAIILPEEQVKAITKKLDNTIEIDKQKDVELECPKCSTAMYKYRYMYTSNIYIDSCEVCEGIWLDKNELLAIMDYLVQSDKVDPQKEAEVIAKITQVKLEYEQKEREFVDSLVKMDDTSKNPIFRGFGEILQSIYSFLYKRGL
jgi:Zn-finger nucleic acid-binding protein